MLSKFWSEYGQVILTFGAIILVAGLAFRAGQNYQRTQQAAQIKVSLNKLEAANPREEKLLALEETLKREGIDITTDFQNSNVERTDSNPSFNSSGSIHSENNQESRECSLVGSKNSDKYHTLDCQWAKRIKEENRVCFKSVLEAESQGYQPAKCCH